MDVRVKYKKDLTGLNKPITMALPNWESNQNYMNALDYLSAVVYGKGDSIETAIKQIEDGTIGTQDAIDSLQSIKL